MNLLAIVNSKCAAFVSECVHGIRFVNAMHLLAMQSSVDWRHCSIASRSTLKIKFRMRFPVTTVYRRAIYLKILSWFVGIKSISFAKSKILSDRPFRSFRGINQSSSNRLSRYVHRTFDAFSKWKFKKIWLLLIAMLKYFLSKLYRCRFRKIASHILSFWMPRKMLYVYANRANGN